MYRETKTCAKKHAIMYFIDVGVYDGIDCIWNFVFV